MARGQLHTPDMDGGSAIHGVIDYSMLRAGIPALSIDVVESREWKDIADAEAFMNEPVVIEIHTTTDKNASREVPVGVNGEQLVLPRGMPVRIPRKFLERLAQSRVSSFRQIPVQNPDADEAYKTSKTTAQEYPFSVLQDRNPLGRRWLERVMREG